MIQRLAKITIRDKALDRALSKIIERFNASTAVRNEFNHCMYMVDASGQITHTQSMRIVQTRDSLQFGEMKPMDDARLKSMIKTTRDMTRINRDIWDFLPRLESHLRSTEKRSPDLTYFCGFSGTDPVTNSNASRPCASLSSGV